jgi:hypothetical protein
MATHRVLSEVSSMKDVVFVVVTLVFFALSLAYVRACEKV